MALGRGLSALIPDQKTATKTPEGTPGEAIVMIVCSSIAPNPYQPRQNFDEEQLKSLADSIAEFGLVQPIVVTPAADGYHLITGERRLRALELLGEQTAPCVIRSAEDQQQLELALIENIQREDLNVMEKALAFKRLIDEFGMTQAEISRKMNSSTPVISSVLSLLKLPEQMQQAVRSGELPYNKARALSLALGDEPEEKILKAWELAKDMHWKEVEREAPRVARSKKKRIKFDPVLEQKQKQLEEVFGTKVRITSSKGKGTIIMEFFSGEELREAIERILSLGEQ